ncbi:hypothetical protein M5K25_008397 [Dendrobium thyrsiflorum]|uniref:Uncharacterized protein n=1 Tax=Dendrobium thyrsiflorum TaxID=117978 RepID=A0ABD0V941_DENTH
MNVSGKIIPLWIHLNLTTEHVSLKTSHVELETLTCNLDSSEHALKLEVADYKKDNEFLRERVITFEQNKTQPLHKEFQKSSLQYTSFKPRKRHHPYRLVNPFFSKHRYKDTGIIPSKVIKQEDLHFQVLPLFAHTTLTFILTLSYPFNSKLLFGFFVSLKLNSEDTVLQSYANRRPTEITYQDFHDFLHISTTGEKIHVTTLVLDACIIQNILRNSIIPKAGDRINITPILSLITYLIMSQIDFNAADPKHKRIPNLALEHSIAFILETKYNFQFLTLSDHFRVFYFDTSFHVIQSATHCHAHYLEHEVDEHEEGLAPIPTPTPINQ